jgi:hypothetical protein
MSCYVMTYNASIEYGGGMFLRNVCSVYQTTRRHISERIFFVVIGDVTSNPDVVRLRPV